MKSISVIIALGFVCCTQAQVSYTVPLPTSDAGGVYRKVLAGIKIQAASLSQAISTNIPDGTTVYIYQDQNWITSTYDAWSRTWDTNLTLQPGMGVFFEVLTVPGSTNDTPITISGTAVGAWSKSLNPGANLLSCPHLPPFTINNNGVAATDCITNNQMWLYWTPNQNLPSATNDVLYRWDVASQSYARADRDPALGGCTAWIGGACNGTAGGGTNRGPILRTWEGFWYYPSSPRTWWRSSASDGTSTNNTLFSPQCP